MDFESYRALPGVNWSTLKEMRRSPLHYLHRVNNPLGETAVLRIGKGIHARVLEPDVFEDDFVVWDGRRQGKKWEAFRDEHWHDTILTLTEYQKVIGAARAILEHPIAADLVADGVSEHVLQWTDPETDLRCKARVDHATDRLVEIKSTGVIDPPRFAALAARLGYHGQLAWYQDGLWHQGYRVSAEPILIAVQSDPPHDVIVYEVPEHVLQAGRDECQRLLGQVAECRRTGHWPGIARDEVQQLILPEWAYLNDDDDLELTMGGEAMSF